MTLTEEGGSLITDIRLLRALFAESDESVVFAPGGGLTELWSGEQDEDDSSSIGEDAGSDENIPNISGINLGRGRSEGSATAQNGSPDIFDDSAEWHITTSSSDLREEEEEDEEEKMLFASGRRLFKCLQLDLSSFGLEKAGLAHQFATLITKEKINLLYSATFR